MAQPVEIFKDVKGMTRDFAVDSLPAGYLWDLADMIPNRKGARVDKRGGWKYVGPHVYTSIVMGGYYAAFVKGQKLLVVADSTVWDVDEPSGEPVSVGVGPATMVQNGVKLNNRVFFFDGAGATTPVYVTYDGVSAPLSQHLTGANTPKAKVGIAYKGRLIVGGDPAAPEKVYFSRLEDDTVGPGPLAAWDTDSWQGMNNEVTGLAGMAGQILVFHPSSIERIRGSVFPGELVDTSVVDLTIDTLTEQVGCTHPHTIVSWRENVIFADERGVFLTDGSVVRNLTELGGIGDFWRLAYGNKIDAPGSISCGTFLNYLIVTVNTLVGGTSSNFTMVCDLNTRAWFRFTNWKATCHITSETAIEECYAGHLDTHKLAKMATMFQDPLPDPLPDNDHYDGDGTPVFSSLTTGFVRLTKEEGMQRVRNILISYHHQTFNLALPRVDEVQILYRTDPPTAEDIDMQSGGVLGMTHAGYINNTTEYSRKKIPVGKRCFGIMVQVKENSAARISRVYGVEVEKTSQDRAKVTT